MSTTGLVGLLASLLFASATSRQQFVFGISIMSSCTALHLVILQFRFPLPFLRYAFFFACTEPHIKF